MFEKLIENQEIMHQEEQTTDKFFSSLWIPGIASNFPFKYLFDKEKNGMKSLLSFLQRKKIESNEKFD